MKKIIAILLACLMLFSLAACGNSGNNGDNGDNGNSGGGLLGGNKTKLNDTHVSESVKIELDNTGITPNGELPDNEEDVDYKDVNYYFNEAINALIQLDEEQMKVYFAEEDVVELMKLRNDKDAYALWQRTVGNFTYLPSGNCWYGRPINVLFAMWYTDQAAKGAELKPDAGLYSYDELVEIYNEYYNKVPVCVEYCSGFDDYYMDDGFIKFEIGSPWLSVGISYPTELLSEDFYFPEDGSGHIQTNNLYEMVLSWAAGDMDWNDYDAIKEDGEFALYDAVMNKDLAAAEALVDATENAFEDEWDLEDYNTYIKNAEANAALKKFIQDKIQVYRTDEAILCLVSIDTAITYGSHDWDFREDGTDAERKLLESVPYCNIEDMSSRDNIGDQFMQTFGAMLSLAEEQDVFDEISFPEE